MTQKKTKSTRGKNRLAPDGVPIVVDWDSVRAGHSVFIPTFNTSEAMSQVRKIAKARGWKVEFRVHIEHKRWGVRVWRMN